MPEGDTIFRAARTLNKALAGKQVTHFESVFPKLNRVDEDQPIAGRTVIRVESHGKHLLMHFSGGVSLRTHMRMSGSWHIYRTGEAWQLGRSSMRILLETADFQAVAFFVNEAEWLEEGDFARSKLARLGPDVLATDFDPSAAVRGMQAHAADPICDVLLDQRALAGVGNVYKSELLFLTKVHPLTPTGSLAPEVLRELAVLAQQHLRANVHEAAPGAITTYRGLRRTTRSSDPGERLWVYGRAGQPCRRCGTPVESSAIGRHVRKTFYCPSCQKLPSDPQLTRS
jgi:endonuclease VIII